MSAKVHIRARLAVLVTLLVASCLMYYLTQNKPEHPPQSLPAAGSLIERPADSTALAAIRLPKNSSKEQVRAYVAEIAKVTQRQTIFRDDDPQFAMLAAVGPGNVDVLIEAMDDYNMADYCVRVLSQLVCEQDKELVLQALPAHKELIRVVSARGWSSDARKMLIAGLAARPRYLPHAWIRAVAAFQEPETYPDLIAYFRQCSRPDDVYRVIHLLPGIHLKPTVDDIWQEAAGTDGRYPGWLRIAIAGMAVDVGNADALKYLVEHIQEQNSTRKDNPRDLILQYTPAAGTNEQIRRWFADNKSRIVFDRNAGKFKLQ